MKHYVRGGQNRVLTLVVLHTHSNGLFSGRHVPHAVRGDDEDRVVLGQQRVAYLWLRYNPRLTKTKKEILEKKKEGKCFFSSSKKKIGFWRAVGCMAAVANFIRPLFSYK